MGRKIDITREHIEWLRDRKIENELTEAEVGKAFRDHFPGVFPPTTSNRNISVLLTRRAKEFNLPLPDAPRHKAKGPTNRWLEANPPLVIQYQPKLAVVSDIHAGSHDPDVIEFIAQSIAERRIKHLVIGGDFFDNAYIGHKGIHSAYATPFNEVISGAVEIWDRFRDAGVDEVYLYQGNHDNKPMRGTQGEWTFEAFLQTEFFPYVNLAGCRVQTTNRYYLTMRPKEPKPWPFSGPENFPWRLTHQKEYARVPLRTASRLATKLLMNVACNHQHHLGATKHESGLFWVADTGCAQQRDAVEYKDMRDSTHPQWVNGYLVLEDGNPIPVHYDQ